MTLEADGRQLGTPYVTARARRGAERCIADAKAYIPFL